MFAFKIFFFTWRFLFFCEACLLRVCQPCAKDLNVVYLPQTNDFNVFVYSFFNLLILEHDKSAFSVFTYPVLIALNILCMLKTSNLISPTELQVYISSYLPDLSTLYLMSISHLLCQIKPKIFLSKLLPRFSTSVNKWHFSQYMTNLFLYNFHTS